jgi:hypothetical protein
VTPEELAAIVAELKAIQRSGLERSVRVGRLVFDRFFRGSVQVWRDRSRGKDQSLRSLADRPDCPFSKSALHQAVSVYLASRSLDVNDLKHVGPSHILAVLTLHPTDQERFVRLADERRWSVRRLRSEVGRYCDLAGGSTSGAPQAALEAADHLRQCARLLLEMADRLTNVSVPRRCAADLKASLVDLRRAQGRVSVVVRETSRGERQECPAVAAPYEVAPVPDGDLPARRGAERAGHGDSVAVPGALKAS